MKNNNKQAKSSKSFLSKIANLFTYIKSNKILKEAGKKIVISSTLHF